MNLSINTPDNFLEFDPQLIVHAGFYNELRKLAAHQMIRIRNGLTLQPTALVNEAWLRLVGNGRKWRNRDHFLAAATLTMRRILLEHARRKAAQRHGGGLRKVDWESLLNVPAPDRAEIILLIDEGITELEKVHPELAQVVVSRFFGGMTNPEIAQSLEIGQRSVERHWAMAKVWLLRWIHQSIHRQSDAASDLLI